MKRLNYFIILVLVLSLGLIACTPGGTSTDKAKLEEEIEVKNGRIKELEGKITQLEEQLDDQNEGQGNTPQPSENVLSTALDVIEIIKAGDMNTLSQFVHQTKGVRFTPYFYIDTENDKVFTAQEVAGLMQDNQIINWGVFDGSGEPIDLSFSDFYDMFVYDKDFANPDMIGNNVAIGSGNTTDNIAEAYPNGHFVEFHFPGFEPEYSGIDWASLRLVFEEVDGNWYLVGIVHGQWTI